MDDSRLCSISESTDGSIKLTIRGKTENMPVYRIPIKEIYYNDLNGRIATWISKSEISADNIENGKYDEYNESIKKLIIESNTNAFKKTKGNIKAFGQRVPGVVLYDGRIIDGNRRFTCLSDLYNETSDDQYNYFEAAILPGNLSPKEIKSLELEIQHGQEEKVDYNPIDKLVDIYRDIIKDKLFTPEEYAKRIDKSTSFVNKEVKTAELMIDFLEFINADEKFYIARELEIDGPIREVYAVYNKLKNSQEEWEKARVIFYNAILMKTKSSYAHDITRLVRKLKTDIVQNDKVDELFKAHEQDARKINEILSSVKTVDTNLIREALRSDNALNDNMKNTFDSAIANLHKETTKQTPLIQIQSINNEISRIDKLLVKKLSDGDKNVFLSQIEKIKQEILDLENWIDNETL